MSPAMRIASPAAGEELAGLVAELASVRSLSGKEDAVQDRIEHWFAKQGIPSRRIVAADGLSNVVVEIDGADGGPTLWIGGHCDTVGVSDGWSSDPFDPTVRHGRLYARGAMDMKGGLATAMVVARDLSQRRHEWSGRLIFASLADEEAYSRGAEAYVAQCGRIDGAVMCEPHFDDVVIGAMGKANLVVEVRGRAAHASHPVEGINAVVEAGRLLARIGDLEREAAPLFGVPGHAVIGIECGSGAYSISVPDYCRFTVNWHFPARETANDGIGLLRELARSIGSPATFDIGVRPPCYDGYLLERTDPFVMAFAESYRRVLGRPPDLGIGRGVSDANILAGRAGIPTLLFGPSGGNMHGADEWLDLSQLEPARAVYTDFALRFLSRNKFREFE
jgi:acetylornithine deacetylase/succinyl-diaminopimelate desuccinylase-like protein